MKNNEPPFKQEVQVDNPGIVGAKWWQESLSQPIARRDALRALLVVGGLVAAAGTIALIAEAAAPSYEFQRRPALAMQHEYGWSFGAVTESLVFDGKSTLLFDRGALAHLAQDLAPSSEKLAPLSITTLFESLLASPHSQPEGDPGTVASLLQELQPISTPAMDVAYKRGQALAASLSGGNADTAVVVDLPGPEAVAFAAGAALTLEPVFLFDNWPHPRGVVKAHLVLAAAAFYQPLFAKAKAASSRNGAPLFVLDRSRLAAYSDDATQFDNRYVARLPGIDRLRALGIKHVLYVAPGTSDPELDDLNDGFVTDAATLEIRRVGVSSLDSPVEPIGAAYAPVARVTAFSTGHTIAARQAKVPVDFGTVSVAVAIGTGHILGARLSRSGSWTRSSSWGGG